jgi:hypothetical protein
MPQLVGFLVEAERLFSIRSIGDDGLGFTIAQPLAQLGAVVSLVAEQPGCGLDATDETLGRWAIMRVATAQEDGKKTAFSICECMDLRIAPAARAADRLFLLPPFPPEAERCALICVESIICVAVDRPRPASSRRTCSQTPRSAHLAKRL